MRVCVCQISTSVYETVDCVTADSVITRSVVFTAAVQPAIGWIPSARPAKVHHTPRVSSIMYTFNRSNVT